MITVYPWNKTHGLYILVYQQTGWYVFPEKISHPNKTQIEWVEWPPNTRSQSTGLFQFLTVECVNRLLVFLRIFECHRHHFSNITLVAKMTLNFKILNLNFKKFVSNRKKYWKKTFGNVFRKVME